MKKEELFQLIGEVDEEKIFQANTLLADDTARNHLQKNTIPSSEKITKHKKHFLLWRHWSAIAVCFCIIFAIGSYVYQLKNTNGGSIFPGNSFWGNGDASVLEAHREDFTPWIEDSILSQFEENTEVLKSYVLLTNEWFLSKELTDFSQVVTTDCFYVIPGGTEGTENISEISNQKAYSTYKVDENGKIKWSSSAYPLEDASVPNEFSMLTHNLIQKALKNITYEDYIITYASRLHTVFVWVRCSEDDMILTFPSRPEFVGMENGGIYTLEELQNILTEVYLEE